MGVGDKLEKSRRLNRLDYGGDDDGRGGSSQTTLYILRNITYDVSVADRPRLMSFPDGCVENFGGQPDGRGRKARATAVAAVGVAEGEKKKRKGEERVRERLSDNVFRRILGDWIVC